MHVLRTNIPVYVYEVMAPPLCGAVNSALYFYQITDRLFLKILTNYKSQIIDLEYICDNCNVYLHINHAQTVGKIEVDSSKAKSIPNEVLSQFDISKILSEADISYLYMVLS